MNHKSRSVRGIAVVLCALIASPQVLEARFTPTTGSNAFTVEDEIKIGQQAAADTNKKEPILPDSNPVAQYVARLGQKLASHAPGEKWPYQFHVVNVKDINAFALPGGPIYVNLGTIQAAQNEAQLAGVMSHEISHVVQRHATRAATSAQKYQIGLGILGALLGRGAGSAIAGAAAQFAVGSVFLKNSRKSESEADLLGTDIMYDSGYDPRQMANFFQILEEKYGPGGSQFFSDHPNPGNRVEAVTAELNTLPAQRSYVTDTPEFDRIHAQAMGMRALTAQEAAQQGGRGNTGSSGNAAPSGAAGDILPSGQLQQFQHQAYSVQYPSNWQVFGDKSSDVTIAPASGVGRDKNGQGAVAYGVIVSIFEGEQGRSASLDDSTHQLMDQLRQSNPDLKQAGQDEGIRVNGVQGRSVDLIGTSPIPDSNGKTQRERDWLVTLQRRDGSVLYLVFIAPERDFQQLRPTYEQMLRSLHVQ
jgi:Zn-dependent protease with chaperone function